MLRNLGQVSVFAAAIASLLPAGARAAEDALAIVTGLAPGDLLNVRADASPVGHIRTRLANGASVKNSGCGDFNGYPWCKVEVVDQPGVGGWVPERYLLAVDPEGTATPTLDEADLKEGAHQASASQAAAPGDTGGGKDAPAAPSIPQNLAARFGDDPAAPPESGQKPDTQAGLTKAETEAYRAAYAARTKAQVSGKHGDTGEISAGDGEPVGEGASAAGGGDGQAAQPQASDTAGVPVPTPRPDLAGGQPAPKDAGAVPAGGMDTKAGPASPEAGDDSRTAATPEPQIVALADPRSPAPSFDATGEIPCARYVGQPMTRCQVGIRREGDGKADVTVTWPDGGTRVIGFYGGKPAGANSRGEFRFTREGDLNMIRVGVSERFEITDTLAFGD